MPSSQTESPDHQHTTETPATRTTEPLPLRDAGTFKATLPELGGFLTPDGTPYQAPPELSRRTMSTDSEAPVPYQEPDSRGSRRLFLTIVGTLLIVSIIVAILVSVLLFSLGNHTIGTADDLLSVLRTSLP